MSSVSAFLSARSFDSTELASLALACNGHTGGVPKPTRTVTNNAYINVPAGTVFDGGWARYERESGACSGSTEGGTCSTEGPITRGTAC